MATPPVIRLAQGADLPAINAIYNHYVLHSTATFQTVPATPAERQAWFHAHGPNHPIVVAELPSAPPSASPIIVGWASLSPYHARSAYSHTVETSVYIHPDYHRQGLGRRLMLDLIARAKTLNYHALIAVIAADQSPSVALHETLGFTRVGLLREVGYKFDRWLDVAYLQLLLGS